jgi:chromosome segregation ATPase
MQRTYVNRILNLDGDVQLSLQKIIEGGPARQDQHYRKYLSVEGTMMDNEQDEITENNSEIEIKYSTSSGYCRSPDENLESTGYTPARKKRNQNTSSPLDSPYMAGSSYSEREIEELRANSEVMKREVELSNQRESEMRTTLEEVEGKHRAASLKQETEFMNLKNELEDKYEDELSALKREVTSLQEFKQEAGEAREEISTLRDELDVNQHSSEKLAFVEDQLRKCKEKLEEMNDTKEALVREEEAHSALISKCLQLENELTALNPLKRQLEEYKTRAVDAEVKVTEYEEDIRTLKSRQETLVGMNEDLHLGAKLHQEVNQEMTKRLVEEANLNHVETLSAVGEGMR